MRKSNQTSLSERAKNFPFPCSSYSVCITVEILDSMLFLPSLGIPDRFSNTNQEKGEKIFSLENFISRVLCCYNVLLKEKKDLKLINKFSFFSFIFSIIKLTITNWLKVKSSLQRKYQQFLIKFVWRKNFCASWKWKKIFHDKND